ncbi:MAG TPA: hypothetical protein VF654_18175 [Pyrinomonadaceae bacterium]
MAMSWFAFFVTTNYIAMSWLAKGTDKEPAEPIIVLTMAGVFIIQNSFGVAGLAWVLVAARALKKQVDGAEGTAAPAVISSQQETKQEGISAQADGIGQTAAAAPPPTAGDEKKCITEEPVNPRVNRLDAFMTSKNWDRESIPNHLYVVIGSLLMLVLVALIGAWVIIGWHYGYSKLAQPARGNEAPHAGQPPAARARRAPRTVYTRALKV